MNAMILLSKRLMRAALLSLLLCVAGVGQTLAQYTNHWYPATGFENNMNVLGPIELDGVYLESSAIEIGSFCNDECRGSAFLEDMGGTYWVLQTIVGNPGEDIIFRLYDHAVGQEVNAECLTTVAFEINATIGFDEPFVISFSSNTSFEHTYVDLGLPSGTLWATCNVGANAPEEYGDYFAWGETQPKDYYDWSTYQYCMGSDNTLTKYCHSSSFGYNGYTDTLTVLLPEDDAATANWGAEWRMATEEEWQELFDNTTNEWTTQNGVNGRLFTAANGASLFLPAAGGRWGSEFDYAGSDGFYWSSSLTGYSDYGIYPSYARYFYCSDSGGGPGMSDSHRANGHSVRAVRENNTLVTVVVTLNLAEGGTVSGGGAYAEGAECTLTATPAEGYTFINWTENGEVVSTENPYTFTVTGDRELVANFAVSGDDSHEYVDLGLPSGTLWATCNVGANSPEDYGDYFAWGETQPKDYYDWNTYQYCEGSYNTLTKYCNDSNYGYNGFTDTLTVLLPEDDAATANWGSGWRMPTKEEWQELYQNTTHTWTTQNGVNGRLFTAANGASLFLPAEGDRWGDELYFAGSDGLYWSSSLTGYSDYGIYPSYARYFYCSDSGDANVDDHGHRLLGFSVRPVRENNTLVTVAATANPAEGGAVSGSGAYAEGAGCTLTATASAGYTFINWTENGEVVSVENPYTFTVTGDRELVANFAVSGDDSHEYVDLGLPSGTLWATCNVGADTPEGYGSYFAWGETEPKDTYNWSTYQYCNGSENTLTKYCNDSDYGYNGFTDNLTVLLPEDDAATANWGAEWRMPTQEEWQELIDNTTSTWTTQNGVDGRLFTAANGASIFLPAAGYRWDSETSYAGTYGCDWSNSLNTDSPNLALDFNSKSSYTLMDSSRRSRGQSVRAVRENLSYVTVTAMANPAEGGTVSGGGAYAEGAACTLTATASAGWSFQNWTENGEVVSVENPYTLTVAGERNLVANFVPLHWTPNTIDYEENMPVTAVVEIDGVEQQSTMLELGAFSGEECRGSQMAMYFEPTQRYIYQMTVFGEEGDEITFRLYDHATNEELDLVAPEAIVFDAFGYGNLPNPIVLNFRHSYDINTTANPAEGGTVDGGGTYLHGDVCTLTATPNTNYVFVNWTLDGEVVSTEAEYSFEVTSGGDYVARFDLVQTTNFSQGWNWWSTYIEQEGTEGLEALENGLGANGSIVKAQNEGYVSYLEGYGWYGSLERLYNEQSYRVQANAACAVPLQGNLTNPADHPITLNPGWTWMGFPWNQAMSVEAALEGFEPEANDFIKGRNAYTMYYAENGYSMWFGPLNSLEPGQGYVYYSNSGEAKTLTLNTNDGRSAQPNVTASDNLFHPEAGDYADNMTLTAVVDFGGTELRSEDYEVAAFCNGECRGSAKLTYFAPTDSYIAFLTLYGNDGDELEFVLTDGDMTTLSGSTLRFATDGRIGTLSEPYPLCFGFTGLDDNAANRVSVYPNPSRDVFNVKGEGIRRIDVFNAFGQVVFSAETSKDTFQVDLSDKATGVYLLRVVTESGVTNQQLIKE